MNLGFLLRENLLLCSSYLPLGVPNWTVIYINTTPPALLHPEHETSRLHIANYLKEKEKGKIYDTLSPTTTSTNASATNESEKFFQKQHMKGSTSVIVAGSV
jgi:hypothetical protein